jgi:hypothetical protein
MKRPTTIESLDRQLRNAAIGVFVVAALYLVSIPLYIVIQNAYARLAAQNAIFRAESVESIVRSMRLSFYFTVPIFCIVLILLRCGLMKNLKQRKQLREDKRSEPSAPWPPHHSPGTEGIRLTSAPLGYWKLRAVVRRDDLRSTGCQIAQNGSVCRRTAGRTETMTWRVK